MDQENLIENRKLWEDLVNQYKTSGKSQTKFCSENNIKTHQLSYYSQKFKKEKVKAKPKFTKAVIDNKTIKRGHSGKNQTKRESVLISDSLFKTSQVSEFARKEKNSSFRGGSRTCQSGARERT